MTQSARGAETAPNIFPFLRYSDAPAAIEWLKTAFGFEVVTLFKGSDGTIAHAELRIGPGIVLIGSATDSRIGVIRSPLDLAGTRQGIYILLDASAAVDAHYRRAIAAGAEIVVDLTDQDYGSREYTVVDPEGHLWSFGTYRPGSS
jgi:uncharacterized glyoxalase superfamily protein PhnB